MRTHNAKNERIKRRYTQYLKEARGQTDTSIDKALSAIAAFERSTRWKGFEQFHIDQAAAFKTRFAEEINPATRKPRAAGTVTATLKALRSFFRWLSQERGYKARIRASDADYFNPSNRDEAIARRAEPRPSPSLEQVRHALTRMPAESAIETRDRAIVALLLLTGIRVKALTGLKLRHVDLNACCIFQDAREVHTKFSKTVRTHFLPVGADVEGIFADYVAFLRGELLWSEDDPLFPKTTLIRGTSGLFEPVGLERAHWKTDASIRNVVKTAFSAHGLPPYGPHSFRKTLTRYGLTICKSAEEMKAWSQNTAHEDIMTTLRSYGAVSEDRQREIFNKMRNGLADG